MADANNRLHSDFKEAVCIDAGKVFDSCCDRDCLEDLKVYFTAEGQRAVSCAAGVKLKAAQVADVCIDVEPVNLSRGFFSCNLTFFFIVDVDIYQTAHSCPCEHKGVAVFSKTVVLCGGEGNIRTFTSDNTHECMDLCSGRNNDSPRCVVQTATPIPLSSRLGESVETYDNIGSVPTCITEYLGGEIETCSQPGTPAVYVTLGLFSIIQIVRNVQVLVPVYDFCMPEKQCEYTADGPCDVFRRIKFPTDDFFPTGCQNSCGCSTASDGE